MGKTTLPSPATGAVRSMALATAGLMALAVLASCGSKVESTSSKASKGSGPCGTVNIAINPWVGYEANAAVVGYVLKHKLNCNVVEKNLTEEVSWQGFASGEVDAILEVWGHDDLRKKYIDQQGVAVENGVTGNKGVIGWYVPPWMAQKYPDITDWRNLNKYAEQFKTSESEGKGQLLDGDPSFVTNDEALVRNLNVNFKVVYAGSEAALIQSFRNAEQQRKPLIGYFYEPQWFLTEVKLVHIKLPAYVPGCDADTQKVACDYQPYDLDKVVSKKFANSGSPAAKLIKKFQWTNDDQNAVAKDIAVNKLTREAAAKNWVEAHPDTWQAWLK